MSNPATTDTAARLSILDISLPFLSCALRAFGIGSNYQKCKEKWSENQPGRSDSGTHRKTGLNGTSSFVVAQSIVLDRR